MYLFQWQAGEKSTEFCWQDVVQAPEIGDAEEYVSTEATTDIALGVAVEGSIS